MWILDPDHVRAVVLARAKAAAQAYGDAMEKGDFERSAYYRGVMDMAEFALMSIDASRE